MSRHRRVLLWAGLLAVLAAVGLATVRLLAAPRRNITVHTVRQIKHGMTVKEVEAILGVSPGPGTPSYFLARIALFRRAGSQSL